VTRTLSPLGVVLKAGRWYLVAESRTRVTAYRVTNILDAQPLDEPVVRPEGFDLAAFWRDWTERYERSVYTGTATVRMTARALEFMAFVFPPEMSRVARASADDPDLDGWVTTVVPIESIRHGHTELLKLGAEAEVLDPPELRELFAATARGLTATYLPDTRADAKGPITMTVPDDMLAHNRQLIEEFRADGGASMSNRPLLLLTTLGRRSGKRRTSPMMFVRDGVRLLVIASNAGATEDPQWYRNLLADPHVTVEVPGRQYHAYASPLTGDDYDRQWALIKEKYPFFAEHERKAGRQIPVVGLTAAG
jgi:deazaflavin-dependent oxidoreductase (nitroreductase family)